MGTRRAAALDAILAELGGPPELLDAVAGFLVEHGADGCIVIASRAPSTAPRDAGASRPLLVANGRDVVSARWRDAVNARTGADARTRAMVRALDAQIVGAFDARESTPFTLGPDVADPPAHAVGIPLRSPKETTALLILFTFDETASALADLSGMGEDVARRTMPALEAARRFEREVAARRKAERTLKFLGGLHTITTALASATTREQAGDVVLGQALGILGAAAGCFLAHDTHANHLELVRSFGHSRAVTDAWRALPINDANPYGEAFLNRAPLYFETSHELDNRYDRAATPPTPADHAAVCVIPLRQNGDPCGVIGLAFHEKRKFDDEERRFVETLADACATALHRIDAGADSTRAFEVEETARRAAERAARRLGRLAAIITELSRQNDPEAVATTVVDEAIQALGASAAAFVVPERDELVVVHSRGFPSSKLARFARLGFDEARPIPHVFRTGEPLWLETRETCVRRFPAIATIFEANGTMAITSLPLVIDGRILGVLHVSFDAPRYFDTEEREFTLALVSQAALSLERARLHAAGETARRQAEYAAARTNRLQSITAAFLEAGTPEQVARVTVSETVEATGASVGMLATVSPDGTHLVIRAVTGAPMLELPAPTIPLNISTPLADAVNQCGIIHLASREASLRRYPHLEGVHELMDRGAMTAIPIAVEGRMLGVLALSFPEDRPLSARNRSFLLSVARQSAIVLERMRLHESERKARARAESSSKERDASFRALAESESRLHAILENSPARIFMKDIDGRYLFVNRRFEVEVGRNRSEVVGKLDGDIFPADVVRDFVATDARAMSAKAPVEIEHHLPTPAGRRRVLTVKFPLLDELGEPYAVCGISTDITDRKRSETELRRRMGQLQAIQTLNAAFLRAQTIRHVHEAALDCIENTLDTGRAAILLLEEGDMRVQASRGLSEACSVGIEHHIPWPRDHREPAPILVTDIREESRLAPVRAALEGDGIRSLAYFPLVRHGRLLGQLAIAHGEHHEFGVDEIILASTVASHIAAGVQRTLAEGALRASEARHRQIVETAHEGIWTLDTDGCTRYVNDRLTTMLGTTSTEMLGRTPQAFLDGAYAEALALRHDKPATRDVRFGRSDGSVVWALVSTSPIRGAEGKLEGWLMMVTDMTDRRRAAEELEVARREVAASERLSALGTLVSGVAHEIRTPLTYITNNLYLLEARLGRQNSDETTNRAVLDVARPFTTAISDGVDRINHLVLDLRRFTQLDAGPRTVGNFAAVVTEAVDLFRATSRGVVTVEDETSATCDVEVNKVQIQQVVLNLLHNAAEAMKGGGTIRVTTADSAGGVILEVADNGPGIPETVREHLFEPFFTTKSEGTGLGLSIARRITEAHGGSIGFDSIPTGGTRFRVLLPAVKE